MRALHLTDGRSARDAYDAALASRDGDAAAAVVTTLLDNGTPAIRVLTDVIAVAQRAVGGRWQRGEWSVAEEHAATATSVSATKIVRAHVDRTPVTRGRVIVACAQREWHELPAMIIECALRAEGWDTTLLGASTSPLRLNQYLQDLGPAAVAVSCSVLGALPSARRFIEASTASGVPILVGGPAFGPDGLRARALGATAWAPTASAAVAAMEKLPAVVPAVPPLAVDVADELGALDVNQRALVERLSAEWSLTHLAETERGRVTGEFAADAVRQVLHAVSAALLTGDPRPVPETAAWISELLRTRGVTVNFTDELGRLLASALGDSPLARAIVERNFPTTG
jgi:MerR family transcriptional regulator, light-induced transcriptional regulator